MQSNKKNLEKNDFILSKVKRMKNILQRIKHYRSAQSISENIVSKEICN